MIFVAEGGDFLHHGGFVVGIEGGLVGPFIDKKDGFWVVHWKKVIVSFVADFGSDLIYDATAHHLFGEFPGVTILAGVVDIDDEAYRLSVHSLTLASVASWEKRWPGCQLPVVVLECRLVSLLPRPEE